MPVAYTIKEKSAYFNEKKFSVSIDSLGNFLNLRIYIDGFKDLPFPINQKYKDTLCKTAFNFDFYSDNKIIKSDYKTYQNTFRYFKDTSIRAGTLHLLSDTINLKNSKDLSFQIPFYAFHSLKRGKQTIELSVSQTVFTNNESVSRRDSLGHYIRLYEIKPLLTARFRFEINMPAIYKSIVYGEGLVLKNDSTFSPASMDNTLWNSSYPDIYWTISYPAYTWYVQTPFEPSTDRYTALDTFNLYHYYQNDSIGFGVFDHDYLSRDDWMGDWRGSLNSLDKPDYQHLKFGYVDHFDVKVKKAGIIN